MRGEVVSQASGDEVKVFKNGDKRGQYLGEITLLRRLKGTGPQKPKQQKQQVNKQKENTKNN